jgi:hypothetical protein
MTGAGQKDAIAWVDTSRVPNPMEWLTQRLGPLAKYEVRPIASADLAEAAD